MNINNITEVSHSDLKTLLNDTTVYVLPAPGYHPLRYLWDWYSFKIGQFFGYPNISI